MGDVHERRLQESAPHRLALHHDDLRRRAFDAARRFGRPARRVAIGGDGVLAAENQRGVFVVGGRGGWEGRGRSWCL